jgi:abortive infection bacteriophage resistance protein
MERIYKKPALNVVDLLKLIRSKQIIIEDTEKASLYMQTVSYHRLSPYLESLLRNNHSSSPLNFDKAWELYCFDRELRLLINDAIERIEVAFRTSLSETMSCRYTPYWFLDKNIFKDTNRYIGFVSQIDAACQDKHNSSIQEYYRHYEYPKYPPSWIIFECLSFGACISAFCNIQHVKDRKIICDVFKEHPTTMQSWLYAIRYTRNLCAHHARVWNRWFVVSPALSFMLGENFNKQNTCYAHLIVLDKLLKKVSPETRWKMHLKSLLEKHKTFPIHEIGFDKDWQNDSFWRNEE